MHQRGRSTDQKGRTSHVFPRTAEAPLMRLRVGTLRQVVKRDLPIAFVPQRLTSYGGLELLRRYIRRVGLAAPAAGGVRGPRRRLRRRPTGLAASGPAVRRRP